MAMQNTEPSRAGGWKDGGVWDWCCNRWLVHYVVWTGEQFVADCRLTTVT